MYAQQQQAAECNLKGLLYNKVGHFDWYKTEDHTRWVTVKSTKQQ